MRLTTSCWLRDAKKHLTQLERNPSIASTLERPVCIQYSSDLMAIVFRPALKIDVDGLAKFLPPTAECTSVALILERVAVAASDTSLVPTNVVLGVH
jgi:hypothetical protein